MKLFYRFLLLIFYSNILTASSIEVAPTKIFFNPDQKFTFITVKNLSKNKVFMQAELLDWDQFNSKNIYTPSNKLIISPPLFSVDAESEQTVRIGRKILEKNYDNEISYRLLLSELPDQFNTEYGLKMLLRLNLPIFVKSPNPTAQELQWSKKIVNKNTVNLSLYNPNNTHRLVDKLELKDKLNKKLYEKQNAFIYLLPKQKYTWTIENNPKLVQHITDIDENNKPNQLAMVLETKNGAEPKLSNALAVNDNAEQKNILITKNTKDDKESKEYKQQKQNS